MASSPPNPKSLFHARSASLPSRPHSFISQVEEHLCRLRATDASCSSSSSICNRLSCLGHLYDSVDGFLQLGQTQQALTKEFLGKQFDKVLDGSFRLLDVRSITKYVLLRTKEQFTRSFYQLALSITPTVPRIEALLCRLRPVNVTSLTLSEINCKLSGLRDLLDSFDKFLLLPQTQQVFYPECDEKLADDLVDGLLLLLDVCGTAKDVLSQAKEHVQDLQSMLRRRRADEFELAKEVGEYLGSRKKAKKLIHKVLKDLKTKRTCSPPEKGNDTMTMVNMARQIQGVTLTTLQSLLFYVSGLKPQSKLSSWALVSNLMRSTHVACIDEAMESNEFEKGDAALQILLGHKTKKSSNVHIENVQTDLGKLELSVEDLEQELECLHRGLIKARVSLLNILNH
ncbi:uncharacterized protein LOC110418102 [Herrania umbratica]|uniref:Uncharacterized protein LOC110418102 n=1 Tax=Herrania umbratica TaxID=108875 RepID=A0A6J1AGR3_9ROSI|nr:uncharacterized protein LOC110418102 [Herrania umbratica]